jgi:perosamine synthetase
MDLDVAECLITPRTRALVLQHTFGIPADLEDALALARRHGLHLIEDCVHSLGATYAERQVGSFGRAAFFSTEETKTISTTMGGMVVTDEEEVAARMAEFQESCAWPSSSLTRRYVLKLALYHLMTQPHLHRYTRALYDLFGERNPLPGPTTPEERRGERPPEYEQRLSNAQAALGLRQLRRLDANLARRRAIADVYRAHLSKAGFRPPRTPERAEPAYVRYPVWVEDRRAAVEAIAPHAVVGTWFTSVLEEADSPTCGGYELGSCERAEEAARHLINLPTHPRVSVQDAELIASAVARRGSVRPEA